MTDKVVILSQAYATCPECDDTVWEILLGKLNFEFENIIGFRCYQCGYDVLVKITHNNESPSP